VRAAHKPDRAGPIIAPIVRVVSIDHHRVTLGGDQLQLNTLGMGVVPMNQVQQIF